MEAHPVLSDATLASHRMVPAVVRVGRRTLDFGVALLALIVLTPVVAVVAIAIRTTSPGPVIYRQRRLGREMAPFTILKFRTMHVNADPAPHQAYVRSLIRSPQNGAAKADGGIYKLAVDDRITRVGRVLRSWSLDEVPQLWNVLRGQMSLVGPRPVIPYEVEHYADWYYARFMVKPGLTGLWQVSGRNERTYEEMVRFDVEYAQRRSVRLDMTILIKTVWVVLRRRGVA